MDADTPKTAREIDTLSQRPLHVLLDTNVVLDLLLRREPWMSQMQPLVEAQDTGRLVGYIPASILTDIFYISRRIVGHSRAFDAVDRCLEDFAVLPVDRVVLMAARQLQGSDFEDNVQIACAAAAHLDLIVTRNTADFAHSSIPAVEPIDAGRYLTT